ncbi:MAG: hypothetical protein L6R40_008339 [Gallowayella cf. fulva]|nr:MAG: hypothetical protein L6R40_008339 [Xanthomendoza cf. fulva]
MAKRSFCAITPISYILPSNPRPSWDPSTFGNSDGRMGGVPMEASNNATLHAGTCKDADKSQR